jgi:hypothetical protein
MIFAERLGASPGLVLEKSVLIKSRAERLIAAFLLAGL